MANVSTIKDNAGVTRVLTTSLVGATAISQEVEHDTTSPATLIAANADVDRVVQGKIFCTEDDAGDSTEPTFKLGIDGTVEAAAADSVMPDETSDAAADVCYLLPAGEALIWTIADGTGGNEAGARTFVGSCLPVDPAAA